ncbi:MAG: cytochrome c oxidase subunit 3 [Pseudomonadota bacterium]|nr:cytochrome c oxidase subunit 3 [Pseudomonadota bacterium]
MADAHAKNHDYHLVDPSPWPVVGAISAFVMAVGAVTSMHAEAGEGTIPTIVFVAGILGVLYTMYCWWKDVVDEAEHKGYHTPVVQLHHRYGVVMFIASEVMFFVAWFWAFFNASLFPTEAMGNIWPPEGIEVFDPWHLPFVNTVILLLSGTTVTWAHHALKEGNRNGLVNGLICTVVLGALFSCVQAYEYAHAPFAFDSGIYASTFFMATGFHGFHVFVGTVFLLVCLIRAANGHFKPDHHFGFEAAAWYWHFVDVVWLFLFCCIYWWGGSGGVIYHG